MRDDVLARRALELFVRQGIRKTSAEDIARACGTTRVTLYRTYGTKEELVRFAIEHVLDEISAATDALLSKRTETVADFLNGVRKAYAEVGPEGASALVEELGIVAPELRERLKDQEQGTASVLVERLLEIAAAERGLNPRVSDALRRSWIDLAIRHLPDIERNSWGLGSPEEVFTQVAELLLYGV